MKKIFTTVIMACVLAVSAKAVTVSEASGVYQGNLNIGGTSYSNKEVYVLPGTGGSFTTLIVPSVAFSSKCADLVLVDMVLNNNGTLSSGCAATYVKSISASSLSESSMSFTMSLTTPSHPVSVTMTFDGEKVTKRNYELKNGGFEGDWSNGEPSKWHSFPTATGLFSGFVNGTDQISQSTDVRPGTTGSHSVKIQTKITLGAKGNGNCTNGQINAGSKTATDASGNYNFSDPSNTGYNTAFVGQPDSLVFWAKYIPGGGSVTDNSNKARANAVITQNARYQDPETADYSEIKIAQAAINYSATASLGWQRISVPFSYVTENSDKEPAYILTTFTTNKLQGGGTASKDHPDSVFLDDVELIYNNHLLSLTRGEEAITFDGESYKINETYCDSCGIFEGVEDGVSAESFFAYDALHKCVFVYVVADDYAQFGKYNVYRIDFTDTDAEGTSIDPKEPEVQGIEETITREARFEKVLINGQLFIRSNDAWYNASGVRVK